MLYAIHIGSPDLFQILRIAEALVHRNIFIVVVVVVVLFESPGSDYSLLRNILFFCKIEYPSYPFLNFSISFKTPFASRETGKRRRAGSEPRI